MTAFKPSLVSQASPFNARENGSLVTLSTLSCLSGINFSQTVIYIT